MRRSIIGGLGLAVFILGAAYLGLRYEPDFPTFMVVGHDGVAAGRTASFRAASYMADSGENIPLEVKGASLDGQVVTPRVVGAGPSVLHVDIPRGVSTAPTITFTLAAGSRVRTVSFPLRVDYGQAGADIAMARPPAPRPTKRALRIELLPEADALISRLDNTVLIRVTDPAGAPQEGASVTIEHAAFSDGEHSVRTDANGLAQFRVSADQPSFRFDIDVRRGAEREQFDRTLVPAGRQLLLRPTSPTFSPRGPIEVDIATWRSDETVFCDLRGGETWRWSGSVEPGAKSITLPPLEAGHFVLQCYLHPYSPGQTWATTAIIVTDDPPLAGLWRYAKRTFPEGAPAPQPIDKPEATYAYLLARLHVAPLLPRFLASTYADDSAQRGEAWEDKKTTVLLALGGVFLLILMLAAELIIGNILATRDRMRAYAADMAEDGEVVDAELQVLEVAPHRTRERLSKTRGVMLAVLVGGTLIANVIGFIALMVLIR